MYAILERMKEVSEAWYEYFKREYLNKVFCRNEVRPVIPLTNNGMEVGHRYQKVTLSVMRKSKTVSLSIPSRKCIVTTNPHRK
jgi:hypothetical protein